MTRGESNTLEMTRKERLLFMDWKLVLTVIGTGITLAAFLYNILRNFRADFKKDLETINKRVDLQEERLFLLATGKTLKEAMIEAKRNEEGRK